MKKSTKVTRTAVVIPRRKPIVIPKGKKKGRKANIKNRSKEFYKQVNIKRKMMPITRATNIKVRRPAKIKTSKNGIRVKHREYLTSIAGSTDLSYIQFRLNPGDEKTFPFLSPIASSYEKYKIHSLRFFYSANCAAIAQGSIISYFDYDPDDKPITDVGQILNQISTSNNAAWQDQSIRYIKKGLEQSKDYYIRNDWTTYENLKLFDPAYLFIGTYGTGDATDLGKVFIDYDIELLVPDYTNRPPIKNAQLAFQNKPLVQVQNNGVELAYAISLTGSGANSYFAGNLKIFPTLSPDALNYPAMQFGDDFIGYITTYVQCGNMWELENFNLNNFYTFKRFNSNNLIDKTYTGVNIDFSVQQQSFSASDWYIVTAYVKVESGDYWMMPNLMSSGSDTANMWVVFSPALYKYLTYPSPDSVSYFENGYTKSGCLQVHTGKLHKISQTNVFLKNLKKLFPQLIEKDLHEDVLIEESTDEDYQPIIVQPSKKVSLKK